MRNKKVFVIALIVAAIVVALALANRRAGSTLGGWIPTVHGQEKANVNGRWVLTVKGTAHGDTTMGLTLKQEGTKVSGTFASPHGDVPVKGEFADNALELATVARSADDPNVTLKAKLKSDGTLSGYLSSQRGDMPFTAERAKDQ